MVSLLFAVLFAGWLSPGMRAHEDEFRQAWVARFGENPHGPTPPPGTYKAWYKQWKKTQIAPTQYLAVLQQGPPGSHLV